MMKTAKGSLSRFLKERLTVETNSCVRNVTGEYSAREHHPNEHAWDHLLRRTGMIKKEEELE